MSLYQINLYRTNFRRDENAIYGDSLEEFQTILNSFAPAIITKTFTGNLKPNVTSVKLEATTATYGYDTGIVPWNYMMIMNNETKNKFYYYIDKMEWVSEGCARFDISLDVLNTYRPKFTSNTHITRQFKDRWKKLSPSDTVVYADIDRYPENISTPPMVLKTKTTIGNTDLRWYLVYYTDYSDDVSKVPLKIGLLADKELQLTDSHKTFPTYTKNDLESGVWYVVTTNNGNMILTLTTGVERNYDLSNCYVAFKLITRSAFEGGGTFIQVAMSLSASDSMTIADVDYISFTFDSSYEFWSTTTSTSTIPIYNSLVNTKKQSYSSDASVEAIIPFDKWYDANKTNSLVTKIIQLPYLPFSVTYDSTTKTYDYDTKTLKPEYYQSLYGFLTPIDYSGSWEILLGTSRDYVSNYLANVNNPNSFYDLNNETKIYHSDFYTVKYIYGNDSYVLKLENVPVNSATVKRQTRINYYLGKTVTSALAYNIDAFQTETTDYEGWIISNQDLSIATFSNEYLNYVKYGQYYDEKALQISLMQSLYSAGSNFSSRLIGTALGGMSANGLIGLGTGLVSSAINIGTTVASARNNLEAKIANYKSQASNISTTNSTDIFTKYQGNHLLKLIYEPEDHVNTAIKDYFRLYGYACDEYSVPTDSRYWNDYYVADVEFDLSDDYTQIMSPEVRSIISSAYSNGVRKYHWHNKLDLNKEYENCEISLL